MALLIPSPTGHARQDQARQDYSAHAADYDKARFQGRNGEFIDRADAAIVRELAGRTRAAMDATLCLDVPAGTGRVSRYLAGLPFRIVSCDLTPEMLSTARSLGLKNQRGFVVGDAGRLPFAPGSFELIVSLRLFHLFPHAARRGFAGEFARVLKPGGWLLCSLTNGWYAGGLNWIRKALGRLRLHFASPGEMGRLFPGWKACGVRGNFLPLQNRLTALGTGPEKVGRWLSGRFPLNLFCWERFYLLQKPTSVASLTSVVS